MTWINGRKIDPADVELYGGCLAAVAAVPPTRRVGFAWPMVMPRSWTDMADLVPNDMWDGVPDEHGLVAWKPVRVEPNAFIPLGPLLSPPLLAYLTHFRACRWGVDDGRRLLCFPATPTYRPGFDTERSVRHWFPFLTHGFYPVAESPDGSEVLFQDRTDAAPNTDSPTLLVSAETAFRLIPRLVGAATTDARPLIRSAGVPHSSSLRELLAALGPSASCPPVSVVPDHMLPPAFDWSPWLTAEVGPDEPVAPVDRLEPPTVAFGEHFARIHAKLDWLRANDPAHLTYGSEWHRHRTNPPLSATELAIFEQTESIRLPPAYAGFLSAVGNGGGGPSSGLRRVEESAAAWQQWLQPAEPAEGRLSRPFPWRAVWDPPVPSDQAELQSYFDPAHTAGAVFLASNETSQHAMDRWLLVVTGPERGHVWMDCRQSGRGIRPVFRRGPYSFLAWLELGLDASIADVPNLYAHQRQTGSLDATHG